MIFRIQIKDSGKKVVDCYNEKEAIETLREIEAEDSRNNKLRSDFYEIIEFQEMR